MHIYLSLIHILEEDKNIRSLVEAETPVVTIFGKSWTLHVREALKTTLDENLRMIEDSVSFLVKQGREVVYDAEHFFDGFKDNPEYALKTLQVAHEAGAQILVLCDTNGGTLPLEMEVIINRMKEFFGGDEGIKWGIHAHNDLSLIHILFLLHRLCNAFIRTIHLLPWCCSSCLLYTSRCV